jgi:lysophospholipase L1-like esterase
VQASVTQGLGALRTAAPDAWIFVLVPPGLYSTQIYPYGPAYVAKLKAGVAAYLGTHHGDKKTVLIDFGPDVSHALASPAYGGGVHPNAAGHAYLAPLVLQAVLSYLRR